MHVISEKLTPQFIIARNDFQRLLEALKEGGRQIWGPIVSDNAIVYDEIESVKDLPVGWEDRHDRGSYGLTKGGNDTLFAYAVGPQSWKKLLYPPIKKVLKIDRHGKKLEVTELNGDVPKMVFLGVRPCELHAISILDKILMSGQFVDPSYKRIRENALIVAVNCTRPGGNCFCVSMGTGPKSVSGFDLALTEVVAEKGHHFVAEAGSEVGGSILKKLDYRNASKEESQSADEEIAQAAASMGKKLDIVGIKEALFLNFDHPHWEEISKRCLTCGNCTMVCPTCFCTTLKDANSLTGDQAWRWRLMDSCFTMDFSYIFGGSIRATPTSRYRQWMMHKLSSWIDQFGRSGCVGCGRCITWCPVGIDITVEAHAILGKN